MVTKTEASWFEKDYSFPIEYLGEGAITDKQLKILTSLILQKVYNEDEREQKLSQLSELSETEADDLIFNLSRW
jgi:hypothetical protein